jgi:anti-sigma factor RsiW
VNAPHVEEELLQRYFDGDLQGAPAASVSQHIATCEDCKKRHVALGELHKLIAMTMEHAAHGIDFERAFAEIERGTRERPAPSLLERLSVWWRDLIEQRPEQLWAPAMGAALAAGLLVFVLRDAAPKEEVAAAPAPPKPPVVVAAPSVPTTVQQAPSDPTSVPPAPPEMANTEIEQVDFGSNAGTVYEIALAGGVSTPVVWINDEL